MTGHCGVQSRIPDRTGTADRDGAADLRFFDPAQITTPPGLPTAAGIELTGTSRPYANTHGTGVRVYAQARPGLRRSRSIGIREAKKH